MSSILDAVTRDASRSGSIPGAPPPEKGSAPGGSGPGRFRSAVLVVVFGVIVGALAARQFGGESGPPADDLLTEKSTSRKAGAAKADAEPEAKGRGNQGKHDKPGAVAGKSGKRDEQAHARAIAQRKEEMAARLASKPPSPPSPLVIPAPLSVTKEAPPVAAAPATPPLAAPVVAAPAPPAKPAAPSQPAAPVVAVKSPPSGPVVVASAPPAKPVAPAQTSAPAAAVPSGPVVVASAPPAKPVAPAKPIAPAPTAAPVVAAPAPPAPPVAAVATPPIAVPTPAAVAAVPPPAAAPVAAPAPAAPTVVATAPPPVAIPPAPSVPAPAPGAPAAVAVPPAVTVARAAPAVPPTVATAKPAGPPANQPIAGTPPTVITGVPAPAVEAHPAETAEADPAAAAGEAPPGMNVILDSPPSGAPEVSIMFVAWSRTPSSRMASMRVGAGALNVVHEGEYVEGLQVSAIHPEAVDFQWTGQRFRVAVRPF